MTQNQHLQDEQQTLHTNVKDHNTLQQEVKFDFPSWPTSRPGPRSTPPPPGMRSISSLRPEQVMEIGYNQETSEPSTDSPFRSLPDAALTQSPSFDQAITAQEELKRRKHRL